MNYGNGSNGTHYEHKVYIGQEIDLEPLHFTATRHNHKSGSVEDFSVLGGHFWICLLFECFVVLVAGVEKLSQIKQAVGATFSG